MSLFTFHIPSPIGQIQLTGEEGFLIRAEFLDSGENKKELPKIYDAVCTQFTEYFNDIRREFDVRFNLSGTTFQLKVWEIISKIPFGKTRSYNSIAEEIGNPNKTRAVGAAVGANPLMIIIPCHRVISTDGKLTGYAGGLHRKQWLLKHEYRIVTGQQTLF